MEERMGMLNAHRPARIAANYHSANRPYPPTGVAMRAHKASEWPVGRWEG